MLEFDLTTMLVKRCRYTDTQLAKEFVPSVVHSDFSYADGSHLALVSSTPGR
jgi:hypothetical protein